MSKLFGGGSKGGSTTTESKPWEGQRPYLRSNLAAIGSVAEPWYQRDDKNNIIGVNLVNNAFAPAYYKGNTIAPQSLWTQQALTMQANAAKNMKNNT